MRALFDTNVLLAAFLTEGVCAKLLVRARKRQFDLITCPFILHEFERTLARKFSATKQERENARALIDEAAAAVAQPAGVPSGTCRDKDDEHVLACALGAEVEYLVSGDKDLLHVRTYRGLRIVSPRDFELLFEG